MRLLEKLRRLVLWSLPADDDRIGRPGVYWVDRRRLERLLTPAVLMHAINRTTLGATGGLAADGSEIRQRLVDGIMLELASQEAELNLELSTKLARFFDVEETERIGRELVERLRRDGRL